MIRSITLLLACAFAAPSIHAAKMQVCIDSSGSITARTKCKAGESPLNLADLRGKLNIPAPFDTSKLLTPSQVTGQISTYLACDSANTAGLAQAANARAMFADLQNYADGLTTAPAPPKPSPLERVQNVEAAYNEAVDKFKAGDLSFLSLIRPRLVAYLAEAETYYSRIDYRKILTNIKGTIRSLTLQESTLIPDFQPIDCGQ